MPKMVRGYNAEGETKAFENTLPHGWHMTRKPIEPAPPKKRKTKKVSQ